MTSSQVCLGKWCTENKIYAKFLPSWHFSSPLPHYHNHHPELYVSSVCENQRKLGTDVKLKLNKQVKKQVNKQTSKRTSKQTSKQTSNCHIAFKARQIRKQMQLIRPYLKEIKIIILLIIIMMMMIIMLIIINRRRNTVIKHSHIVLPFRN